MIRHGNGWMIEGGGGFYPNTVFRVRDTITNELQRITGNYNNPFNGTEGDALSFCETQKHLLYRLIIEKVEILEFKPA